MESFFTDSLSLITFFPILGIIVIAIISLVSENPAKPMKIGALLISLVEFFLSLPLFFGFNSAIPGFQFETKQMWFPDLGINYHIGLDGISLLLVLLTTFMTPIAILSSWDSIKKGLREFLCLLLFLETALIGTFVALDMILFFVFWEAVLIPMYFIIGIWGTERRIYAAVKFFIYTALGSSFMLVAILYLYYAHISQFGYPTMDIAELYNVSLPFSGIMSPQGLCFLAFFLAFAIKVPMFPFHTWLPDAHVEAPTAGSVILAGVLLKMGTYGFLRFIFPLFPESTITYMPVMITISIIGIIYGAMVAFAQKDLKKLVAYSSVSHLGLIMLGILVLNIQGVQGGIYQMVGHGLSTGALFLLVGMIYDRRKTKKIEEFGGVASVMPVYALFFMLAMLSSIGLPLLNGFIGELLILMGVFSESYWYCAFGATGLVLGAVYMLWAYQRVMFGPLDKLSNKLLKDLNAREIALMIPIVILFVLMGVYPSPFLSRMEPSVDKLLKDNYTSEIKENYRQQHFDKLVKYFTE